MTPSLLQDALVEELRRLFCGKKYKNTNGESVALNIFKQHVPLARYGNDDMTAAIPYLLVSLDSWSQTASTDATECKVIILASVFDDSEEMQGHKDLLNIIEDIYLHLRKHHIIAKTFRMQHPIEAALSDEDTFPFFFGAIETNYYLPNVYGNPKGDDNI